MEIHSLIWNSKTRALVLWLLRFFLIHKGQVICASWAGAKYNCNPRAIVEEILRQEKASCIRRFQINYAFIDPEAHKLELPEDIKAVEIGSLEYYYILATSQFIIFNTRMSGIWFPYKKKGQLYIQTMHGGQGLKKVELDAKEELSQSYIKDMLEDASRINLMISNSRFWTNLARTAFAYTKGEILEEGLPRNDAFFSTAAKKQYDYDIKEYVAKDKKVQVPCEVHFLVYAPTFRNNGRTDVYGFDADKIIKSLEKRFGGAWYILVSSHPNMRDYYKGIYDFSHPRLVDMGEYPDLQPLLIVSDAALTDYSSAGFEFSISKKPVFLLIRDLTDYDRGTYFNPKTLPFPYAENDFELCQNIESFDNDKYQKELEIFNRDVIGLHETGHAAEAVVEWMNKHL